MSYICCLPELHLSGHVSQTPAGFLVQNPGHHPSQCSPVFKGSCLPGAFYWGKICITLKLISLYCIVHCLPSSQPCVLGVPSLSDIAWMTGWSGKGAFPGWNGIGVPDTQPSSQPSIQSPHATVFLPQFKVLNFAWSELFKLCPTPSLALITPLLLKVTHLKQKVNYPSSVESHHDFCCLTHQIVLCWLSALG